MPNCNTIAICNQKGGVGKTTTTVNLGVGLAMQGKKVLLVDADPQGDLTTCLGWKDTDNLPVALPDKMVEVMQDKCKEPMKGILHHKEGVDLIPSNSDLFDFEISLVTAMNREAILRNYLNEVKHNYDYIIIDCSPSLGMMTLNALSAADSVIIPVQAHYLPAKCMTQLMRTITKVKKHINPKLSMRKMFEEGKLTPEAIQAIMSEQKPNQREKIVLRGDRVRQLIPKSVPLNQTEDFVCKALEHYNNFLRKRAERDTR